MPTGTVYGVGVGPGDPELVTVKAASLLARSRVVAYFAKRGKTGNAFAAAERYLHPESERMPLVYPYTVELAASHPRYVAALDAFYGESAARIAQHIRAGRDVAVLCEGDPLFYGSYLHLHLRLSSEHRCEVIPGITSFAGCAARAGIPLVWMDRVFSIVPGTLPEHELEARLRGGDPTAIIKLGRNFGKVKAVLERVGRARSATYVERGTTASERIVALPEQHGDTSIYFSLILVPAADARTLPSPLERDLLAARAGGAEHGPSSERSPVSERSPITERGPTAERSPISQRIPSDEGAQARQGRPHVES